MTWSTLFTSRRAVHVSLIGLLLSVSVAVPIVQAQQLIVEVSIDEATYDRGLAVVTGTVTCSAPTDFTSLTVTVRQPVGRFQTPVEGSVFDSLGPCDGELPFSVSVAPNSGSFKPGNVFILVDAFACNEFFSCDGDSMTDAVRLMPPHQN